MHYRAEIDGLRGLSVSMVILFHAGVPWFDGGFLGVDIFFVISGFLITSIVFSEIEKNKFSITDFYQRRLRRLGPALLAMLLFSFGGAFTIFPPDYFLDFSYSAASVLTFLSNMWFLFTVDYFSILGELNPLLHTWSLAIEEQFYLVFPAIAIVLGYQSEPRRFFWIMLTCLVSFSLMVWLQGSDLPKSDEIAFYFVLTRAWELLFGSSIALLAAKGSFERVSETARDRWTLLGLVSIVVFCISNGERHENSWFAVLFVVLGTGLILAFARNNLCSRFLLQSKFIVSIGAASYSLYLFHQPVFAFSRWLNLLDGWVSMTMVLAVCVCIGYLSYWFVELPTRNVKKIRDVQLNVGLMAVFLVLVVLITVSHATSGGESRLDAKEKTVLGVKNYPREALYREGECFLRETQKFSDLDFKCWAGSNLLLGDSYAAALYYGLSEGGDVAQATASACPPLSGYHSSNRPYCHSFNQSILSSLDAAGYDIVILAADWTAYEQSDLRKLRVTVDQILSKLPSAQVVVIGSVPKWVPSLPVAIFGSDMQEARAGSKIRLRGANLSTGYDADSVLVEILGDLPNVSFVPLLDHFCNPDGCHAYTVKESGEISLTAWDDGHLTKYGSQIAAIRIFHAIAGRRIHEQPELESLEIVGK